MRYGADQPFLAGQRGLFTRATIARDNNCKLPIIRSKYIGMGLVVLNMIERKERFKAI